MTFSLTRAVGLAGEFASLFTSADLELRFQQCELDRFQPPPSTGVQRYAKTGVISATTGGALKAARRNDQEAAKGLQLFIAMVADRCAPDQLVRLEEATRSGGFDLRVVDGRMRLLPLDEPHAPLSDLITAVEADFDRLGMTTARTHYRQAVASLVDGRSEAANSQLRATFEEVVAELAGQRGFVRSGQGGGGQAINHLINNGDLPDGDGGGYIRGLWKVVHTNGPHPGTSPAGEAHFRTQAITAAIRYLIDRLAPQP